MTRAALVLALCSGCYFRPEFTIEKRDAAAGDDADIAGGDGPVDAPDTPNIAFVTSVSPSIDELMSVTGADALCDSLATTAQLEENTYIAWLSTPTMTAPERLGTARGWVRVDKSPFADTVPDILSGTIYTPLRLDENGVDVHTAQVATATKDNGVLATSDCSGLVGGTAEQILVGSSDATRTRWTDSSVVGCGVPVHLYCFGIDKRAPVAPPGVLAPARRAFLSNSSWTPGQGRGAADGICAGNATNASLPGTYLALLGADATSAMARFQMSGGNWVRLDGIPLAASPTAFATGAIDAPLNLDPSGTYVYAVVWTGIDPAPNSFGGQTCTDWVDASGFGEIGYSSRTSPEWLHNADVDCTETHRVYCLQE